MGEAERAAAQERRYAEAVETFGSALERLARAYERDADKRRDLLQEIHVSLWRSFARFDGRCSLRTWVYRVAHNTATSKTIRPRTYAPVLVAIDAADESIGAAANDEEGFDRRRALERLHGLIRQLEPLDRQVIILHLEGLPADEIAVITGISSAHTYTKLTRIRQLLAVQVGAGDNP